MSKQTNTYDAIVVGSGITGGWAAKELCEKGLKTLVLERGRDVPHPDGYTTTNMAPWEYERRGSVKRDEMEDYNVQGTCYAFNESTKHFFVNDKDHPYETPEDKPFGWIRGYHVGGRSLTWHRQCYRLSDLDFEANAKDGHGVDWPIRYKDLEPWYNYVEEFVGITGINENLPQLPDSNFLPAMPLNCVETHVRKSIEKNWNDRTLTKGRAAHLTVAHKGRGPCQYRNLCHSGCPFGGYFSSNSATLPAAAATGNMTLRPWSIVHSVIYDENLDKATGVRIIDAQTKEVIEYKAKVIFLCASTLGSTSVLMNSKSNRFENGLGGNSGALGHYLMDHIYEGGANGDIEGFEDKIDHGHIPNGIYIPRFRNIKDSHPDFLRGYGMQGNSWKSGWTRGMGMSGFGADFKKSLLEPDQWHFGMGGWGEHLPNHDNKIELNYDNLDQWGLPILKISCSFSDNELDMRKDMVVTAAEMLEAAGAKNINTYLNEEAHPGTCIHEMGTARMGRDPKTSVLNGHNQVWDAPNVFVTDGAAMTSSAWQNPSLTYMALTARACDYAVNELKKGNL